MVHKFVSHVVFNKLYYIINCPFSPVCPYHMVLLSLALSTLFPFWKSVKIELIFKVWYDALAIYAHVLKSGLAPRLPQSEDAKG